MSIVPSARFALRYFGPASFELVPALIELRRPAEFIIGRRLLGGWGAVVHLKPELDLYANVITQSGIGGIC